jgi:hypothetical protein
MAWLVEEVAFEDMQDTINTRQTEGYVLRFTFPRFSLIEQASSAVILAFESNGNGGAMERALAICNDDLSIANDTFTTVPWEAAHYDTANIWSSGNPTRLTCPRNGVVILRANGRWPSNSSGVRRIYVTQNDPDPLEGSSIGMFDVSQSGFSPQFNMQNAASAPIPVQEGDFFELNVWQNSGGSLNFRAGGAERCWFCLKYIQ